MFTTQDPCTMELRSYDDRDPKIQCHFSLEDINYGRLQGCSVTAPDGSVGDGFNCKVVESGFSSGKSTELKCGTPSVRTFCGILAKSRPEPVSWDKQVLNFGVGNCNDWEAWKKVKIVSAFHNATVSVYV